jgi:PAS domain S-box-containing protein
MGEEAPGLHDRFFDLSLDMLCIAHFSGYFKRLNPAWERTLGFTREELQSKPMFDFVHPEDRERTLDQNRKVRAGGQALAFENRYLCKDGSYRWFLWNATADVERQLIYSLARDITARKQAEEERERLLRELQAALAEVKELQTILPICMYCNTHTTFTHGICPTCYKKISKAWLDDTKSE